MAFSYFFEGLEIINCEFEDYLDFSAGGHNKNNFAIRIEKNIFSKFVNFFDCWFEGPFYFKNNTLKEGTNLNGNANQPFKVSFDIEPTIEGNIGEININSEGEKV